MTNLEKPLEILILEDLPDDVEIVRRILTKEKFVFNLHQVDAREEFIRALDQVKPDLVLSDHSLPQFNSMEALKICKEKKLDVPFVLVTGTVSEEFAVQCLKEGADDYVLKSNLSRLPISIRYALKNRQHERARMEHETILKNQNDELLKINKELDSFVYSVSHNLRSPLASVLGLVNIARLDIESNKENTLKYLDLIERSVGKLDHTLRDILNYSRNSRSEVDISAVDLRKLMEECFEELRYMNGHERIEKRIEIIGNNYIHTDAYRLKVVLANLLSNAIKYSDPNKSDPFICLRATITEEGMKAELEDNGIGIEKEYADKVFRMFFRAEERSDGAGLGLYIVKEMIERIGGEIQLSSDRGTGTRFSISVPDLKGKSII